MTTANSFGSGWISNANANGSCPYPCLYKTNGFYCQFTCCVNPEHNGSGLYQISKEELDLINKKKMEEDQDYGRGIYA